MFGIASACMESKRNKDAARRQIIFFQVINIVQQFICVLFKLVIYFYLFIYLFIYFYKLYSEICTKILTTIYHIAFGVCKNHS